MGATKTLRWPPVSAALLLLCAKEAMRKSLRFGSKLGQKSLVQEGNSGSRTRRRAQSSFTARCAVRTILVILSRSNLVLYRM
jgi:hypothetical protein